MEIEQYLHKQLDLYRSFLAFVDNEADNSEDYVGLYQFFEKEKIDEEKNQFLLFLLMVSKICENHYRHPFFIKKIQKIILHYEKQIKSFFSNSEINDIFANNLIILLFLLENKILIFDNNVLEDIQYDYSEFFDKEIFEYQNDSKYESSEIDDFDEKRHIGENDSKICQLIRSDSLDDFIVYLNTTNFQITGTIPYSKFETNYFLLEKNYTTLIEYAAFNGSIKIFKYLLNKNVEVHEIIWQYAIHGNNAEIIQILEEQGIQMPNINLCLQEAIKCHHNEIGYYIQNNYKYEEKENFILECFKSYNYEFCKKEDITFKSLICLLTYKYFDLIKLFLKSHDVKKQDFLFDKNEYNDIQKIDKTVFSNIVNSFKIAIKKSNHKKYIINTLDVYKKLDLISEEFRIQIELKYPVLNKLRGLSYDGHNILFLYKYYQNETLEEYFIKTQKKEPCTNDYIIMLGILIGLKYLESKNILNTQLYPDNIYLDDNFYPIISQYASHRFIYDVSGVDIKIPQNIIWYSPLETLVEDAYTNKSLVYIYSLIVYQLLTKLIPYEKMRKKSVFVHARMLSKGGRPDVSRIKNQAVLNFFESSFDAKPENRMSLDEIFDMITNAEFYSYFENFDKSLVIKYLDIFGDEFSHLKSKF